MICKWCGETVKPGDKTCRRCRREVSPLSDCGGFYDLVPQAQNVAAPVPSYDRMEMPVQQTRQVPVKPVLPEKKQGKRDIVALVAAVLAVVMLVCAVSLSGKLKAANAQIDNLKKELADAEEQVPQDEPTSPSDPGGDGPGIGGEDDPENPVEDVVLNQKIVEGYLEMMLTEEANAALAAGKKVEIICTDEDGAVVCTLTFTSMKIQDEVHVTVTVNSQWEGVYMEWYDPENEERPMTWNMLEEDEDMFTSENVVGKEESDEEESDEDEKSSTGQNKDKNGESTDGTSGCEVTVKLGEEPFNLSCLITAKSGRRDIRIVIDNIHIG